MPRALPVVLTAGALIWLGLLLAAPYTPAGAFVYEIAARVCHQRPDRSFHLGGVPLPVCARCFGLYLSGAVGAVAAWGVPADAQSIPGAARARMIFLAAALPTIATVALERFGLAAFSNLARAIASFPLGAAAGWLFVRMLRVEAPVIRRAHV